MKRIVLLSILLLISAASIVVTQIPSMTQEKVTSVAASEPNLSTRIEPTNTTGAPLPFLTANSVL
ncbi:hypothetical protein KBA63_01735, partial [Candidatus Woesebacteria bacterium]|nr:hypothetical protein [Candidatus Woesebacteria bacterium]